MYSRRPFEMYSDCVWHETGNYSVELTIYICTIKRNHGQEKFKIFSKGFLEQSPVTREDDQYNAIIVKLV